jgi:hypothetical protein
MRVFILIFIFNLKKMPLIHTYVYGEGGIGDFLRSVFAYYVYCKKNKIPYYLLIENHPFQFCFKKQDLPSSCLTNLKMLVNIGGDHDAKTFQILQLILNGENYIIRSNIWNFIGIDELRNHREEFVQFLNVTPLVLNNMKRIVNCSEFSSIHIRCGDKYMNKVNIECDSRISPSSVGKEIDKCIKYFESGPIVLFTDNEEVRKIGRAKGLIVPDTSIQHTALISDDIQGYVDAVSEFFLIGRSREIIAFSESGFSFWPSVMFGVRLIRISEL